MMPTQTITRPSWSAIKRKDVRRHRRFAVHNSSLRVSWLDVQGQLKMAVARVLNVSESGMAVELPEKPLPTSMVRFQSEKHRLSGTAAVRHAYRFSSKWVVGVEFSDGLRWMPPDGEVEEPITLFGPEYVV